MSARFLLVLFLWTWLLGFVGCGVKSDPVPYLTLENKPAPAPTPNEASTEPKEKKPQ